MMKISGLRQSLPSTFNRVVLRQQRLQFRQLSVVADFQQKFGATNLPVAKKVDDRYISPWPMQPKKATEIFRMLLTPKYKLFPSTPDTSKLIEPAAVDLTKLGSTAQPHVTWLGHATCFYQTEGVFFLTDPFWSDRASPSQFLGPKRYVKPPVEIEDLKVDMVLLSHTHYDHLDRNSAERIGNKALWIVPLGVKTILLDFGITNFIELDWWQSHTYKSSTTGNNIEVTFTPTKHWTARSPFDRNTCLWGSFAVRSPQSSFFFTGDTAYCDVFKQIGEALGPFDFAAIPIGAYAPRWFMKDAHCDPAESVRIHQDLRAQRSFAIHWGTLPLSDEDFVEPALELARSRDVAGVTNQEFFTSRHGETLQQGETSAHDFATAHPEIYAQYLHALKSKPSDEE